MSDSSYVLSLFGGGSSDSTASILSAIYNTGTVKAGTGSAYGITSSNPVLALQEAQKNEQAGIAYEAKQPQIERTIQNFDTAVAHATSVTQLLANPAVLNVLLTANNLGSQTSYTALAQQALESDPSDPNSLANKLSDSDWKSAAETYNFATQGLSVIQSSSVIAELGSAYAQVEWENTLNNAVPGLSNALAFVQGGTTGLSSAESILGNSNDRTVVTTALGIPQQIAFQDLGAQELAINNRIDVSQFNSQTFVTNFAERYLLADASAASSTAASNNEASLIA